MQMKSMILAVMFGVVFLLVSVLFFGFYGLIGMMFGVLASVSGYLIYTFMVQRDYPIIVPYISQRGKSIMWDFDRGKYTTDDKGYKLFKLLNNNKLIKPPAFDVVSVTSKGKDVFPLYAMSDDNIKPLIITKLGELAAAEDISVLNWNLLERKRTTEKYPTKQSTWDKYGMIIVNMAFLGLLAFTVFFIVTQFQVIAGTVSSGVVALAEATKTLAEISARIALGTQTAGAGAPPPV